MSEPLPWTCARCGGPLAWTASTVGCRPCRTIVTLPGHGDQHDEHNEQQQ